MKRKLLIAAGLVIAALASIPVVLGATTLSGEDALGWYTTSTTTETITTETTATETTPPSPRCPEGQVPIGGKDGDESEPHHNQECCYDVNANGVCDDQEQPPTTTSRETTPAVSPPPDTTTEATTDTQPTETVPPETTSPPSDTGTTPAAPPAKPQQHGTPKPPRVEVVPRSELPHTGQPMTLAGLLGLGLLGAGVGLRRCR